MTASRMALGLALCLTLTVCATTAFGQQAPAFQAPPQVAPATAPPAGMPPLQATLTVMRFQGEKKVSSVPYTLTLFASRDQRSASARLRLGTQLPVPMGGGPSGGYQYRDVGTSIDLRAAPAEGGGFEVSVTLEDSAVPTDFVPEGRQPIFRNMSIAGNLRLRDGETGQFLAATDKTSGDVIRVDVGIKALK